MSESTLLQYKSATKPDPLQAGVTSEITLVADNPGYSDQPAENFVQVHSIDFDCGVEGSGGPDLTADAAAIQVQPPEGWGAPVRDGLRFTFSPPPGGEKVFPKHGLTFSFSGIAVNATIGTVNLDITETASSPGDPANPDAYPSKPDLPRNDTLSIGKFPAEFQLSPLGANPLSVSPGGTTTLSWSGSKAIYELLFPGATITTHANGTKLQPHDTYPNSAMGDPPLTLRVSTVFDLKVSYTPDGSNPATVVHQTTVAVVVPKVLTFDATPATIDQGEKVKLSWSTSNADYCIFDPPLNPKEPDKHWPAVGSTEVEPDFGTQGYTIYAWTDNGFQSKPANLGIVFNPPSIESFDVSLGWNGDSLDMVEFSWKTKNAETVDLAPGGRSFQSGSGSGSATILLSTLDQPYGDIEFQLVAKAGVLESRPETRPFPKPEIKFSIDPSSGSGDNVPSWTVFLTGINADHYEVNTDGFPSGPYSGSLRPGAMSFSRHFDIPGSPPDHTSYNNSGTVTGPGGKASAGATYQWGGNFTPPGENPNDPEGGGRFFPDGGED